MNSMTGFGSASQRDRRMDIDGALVGGASLKVDSFVKIVRYKS